MLRSSVAALLALALAVPAAADWTEIVGTGGPTSGRIRWDRTASNYVGAMRIGTTTANSRWRLDSADTLLTLSLPSLGGSGTDEYYGINAYYTGSAYRFSINGHQENGVADRAYIYSLADAGPATEQGIVNTGALGASLGFAYGVVTHNTRTRWALGTASANSTSNANWYGGTAMPGTAADDTEVISSGNDVRYNEGCVTTETTTPAAFGALIKTDGSVLVSRLVAAGDTAVTTLPIGWGSGDTIQIGQCFMIGTRFVVVADNVTDGNVFVGIVGTTPSFEQTQTISGDVVGGVALSGTGYIMASTGTLYSSDGTTTFADASDTFAGGTPLLLSLNGAGDAVLVWDADGDISQRIFPPDVTTGAASSITQTTATLNGTVNPNGLATTGSFDYGLTTGYGSTASAGSLGSGTGNVAATADITGLTCGTTYHFRATATNADGATNGSDATFSTSACSASGGGVKPAITFRAVGFEPGGFKPEGFTP